MAYTRKQMSEFEEACKPLVKWLNDNCHPHVKAIVEPTCAELVDGMMTVKIEEFIHD